MLQITVPKIKAVRHWNSCEVRQLCIKNEWYTHGDCQAYSDMLGFVDRNDPTTENIYLTALDICQHSFDGDIDDDDVTTMMEQIEKSVVDKFYYIGEEE